MPAWLRCHQRTLTKGSIASVGVPECSWWLSGIVIIGELLLVVVRLSARGSGFWKAKDEVHKQRRTRIKATNVVAEFPSEII